MHELIIEAKLENLDKVLEFVKEHLEPCPPKIRNQINIVVDEIFSNIARYAYNPQVGAAKVCIGVGDDITLEFEDSGVPYNPLEEKDPDISLSAEEREVGGLGIFMVKSMMNSVEYRRENNKNVLTIRKSL